MAIHDTALTRITPNLDGQLARLRNAVDIAQTIANSAENIASKLIGPYPAADSGTGAGGDGALFELAGVIDALMAAQDRANFAHNRINDALHGDAPTASQSAGRF